MKKIVFNFKSKSTKKFVKPKYILGGKGANLAEMGKLGFPVPPGFTISTLACELFYKNKKKLNSKLINQIKTELKIIEKDNKHDSLEFEFETLKSGGISTGFSCPDNLLFDKVGNLWFTSDMSASKMNKSAEYLPFKNNGLFVLIRNGIQSGEIIQVASAPIDAEFTGPCFSPDGKTLFLSVQHPGERSSSINNLTSTWPNQKGVPKSSVITIEGELIDKLTST